MSAKTYRTGGKLRSLLEEMLHTKKENIKRTKGLLSEVNKLITKESLIIQLRTEHKYIKLLNLYYKQYLSLIKDLKEKCFQNKNGVKEFCDELRKNGKDDTVVIDKYEEKIRQLKKEKKEIIKTNEGIIKIKNEINIKLKTRLLEIQTKINMNLEEISKQEKKIKSLEDKKEKQKQEFLKEEEIQKKKYKKLKLRCDDAEEQIIELGNKISKMDLEKGLMSVQLENYEMANDIIEKENKDIQLKEEEIKNQNLIEEIKELTNKISHFSFDDHSTKINTISNNTHKSPIVSSITKKKSLFSIIK